MDKLEKLADFVAGALRRDPKVRDVEQSGLYGLRVKLSNGQIILIRIGLEP